MKVTFKLTVNPVDQVAVTLAIRAVARLHQERVTAGEAGHYYFNSDQHVQYGFDAQGDLLVTLEGERCPIIRDGLMADFKAFVFKHWGSTQMDALTLSQRAFSGTMEGPVAINGVECIEYQTSDSRLDWDTTLADWYVDHPDHPDTVQVFNEALWNGDIYFTEAFPHGRLNNGPYTASQETAVNVVCETLDPNHWQKHAELVGNFHAARAQMLSVIGK